MYKIFRRHKRLILPVLFGLLCNIGFANIESGKSSEVELYATDATRITLSPDSVTLMIGETYQFKATYSPADADATLTWFSGDTSIAEVNNQGFVTAISAGVAIIYAQGDNGVTGFATVTVEDNSVVFLTVTPDDLLLEVYETAQLKVEIEPSNANSKISWSSQDPSIAQVNDDGLVTAVNKGITFIYARSDNGVTGVATVTVIDSNEITSIRIVPDDLNMVVGENQQMDAIVRPATSTAEITWLSANTSVAEVSDEGYVTAISPGITIIYALSSNGVTGLATVRVESNEVTSVTIDPDMLTLEIDGTGQLTAFIEPGSADAGLVWSSSDTSVAEVDNAGNVRAREPGYSFIYATSGNGVTGVAVVRVIDPNAEESPDHGYGDNGVYVSALRIREGDGLGLFADRPTGYENNDWVYEWYEDGEFAAAGKYVILPAGKDTGWQGNVMSTTTETFEVDITNAIGDELILELPAVSVYTRPLTPTDLLRKGDGRSHTFIAMSQFTDSELGNLGYSFVFGYTDGGGVNHVISNSRLRYCETTKEIYDNESYRFWVYTTWTFPDGAVITSGQRFLDGSVNESFDRSDFNFSARSNVEMFEGDYELGIYTIQGYYVGKDINRLGSGLYIIHERKGNMITTRKIIKS